MKLLLIRHAIAEEVAASPRRDDASRRLTDEGRSKMQRAARALPRLLGDLALVVSSPLARAVETAEIVVAAYPDPPQLVEEGWLGPEFDSAAALRFFVAQRAVPSLALVGHEPNLAQLLGYLLTGEERAFALFKKGGAALVELDDRVAPGGALLHWHLTPAALRAIGA